MMPGTTSIAQLQQPAKEEYPTLLSMLVSKQSNLFLARLVSFAEKAFLLQSIKRQIIRLLNSVLMDTFAPGESEGTFSASLLLKY